MAYHLGVSVHPHHNNHHIDVVSRSQSRKLRPLFTIVFIVLTVVYVIFEVTDYLADSIFTYEYNPHH